MLDQKVSLDPASFRDPSGFIFYFRGRLYRQVNHFYRENYELLLSSGLYDRLTSEKLLIPHREVKVRPLEADGYKVIQPEPIPIITYPYEWSFGMLQDAALLTLKIQKIALEGGLTLKDASAYNIQFVDGKPILLDTLSFEKFEKKPWIAYRQFCTHFLAPLALMSLKDIRLAELLQTNLDGIPLDLTTKLLPPLSRLNPGLFIHLHLHAGSERRHAGNTHAREKITEFSLRSMLGLVDSLAGTIRGLKWSPRGTEWADYYDQTNYSTKSLSAKEKLVRQYILLTKPHLVWDIGANTGRFSQISAKLGILTVASDIDPAAVERNYLNVKNSGETKLLPLVSNVTNPSPGLGWGNDERQPLLKRVNSDTVLALALIHHLAIGNNLPLPKVAEFLSKLGRNLIIEFVPKDDSQVRKLLATREDIFTDYHRDRFEEVFRSYFKIVRSDKISGTERTLYLMRARCGAKD